MDIQIITVLRTTANNAELVANAVYGAVQKLLAHNGKGNGLVSFQAMEIRPNSQLSIQFPDDLDLIQKPNDKDNQQKSAG